MADITDIVDYYVNLLIIQYHDQPKAQATIRLFAEEMLASGILLDIQNAYNIDTAVGVQLDVIGKYVGVDRYYSQLDLQNFFSLITYDEVASPPSSPPRWGFETYATFGEYNYNGTLIYGKIINSNNSLSDEDFRTLIKFMVVVNASNFSNFEIDEAVFNSFGDLIRAENNGNMSIVYFIQPEISPLITALLFKQLLPAPMGVNKIIVSDAQPLTFGLTDYSNYESAFAYGFSDYADFSTLAGSVLTYNQISEG